VVTAADEAAADFSPDGKRLAYVSDDSGLREIYVRDFAPDRDPAVGAAKIPISIGGGDKPCWSRDGKELYYIAPTGKLMAVPIKMTPSFNVGLPVPLFELNVLLSRSFFPYDVGADGHLLVNTLTDPATSSPPITVVLNWMSALKK
jgi:Tol biopolymer transport system component